jgi:hypothetical protein
MEASKKKFRKALGRPSEKALMSRERILAKKMWILESRGVEVASEDDEEEPVVQTGRRHRRAIVINDSDEEAGSRDQIPEPGRKRSAVKRLRQSLEDSESEPELEVKGSEMGIVGEREGGGG